MHVSERWTISPDAFVLWREGRIELVSTATGATLRTDDPGILAVLHAFARPRTIEAAIASLHEVAADRAITTVANLISAGFLEKSAEQDGQRIPTWGPTALAFHRTSRKPTLPAQPTSTTEPVVAPYNETVVLEAPTATGVQDLASALDSRHSTRAWGDRPIPIGTFSCLLWMSARNRAVGRDEAGRLYVNRPYPSGGAAYSLELYLVVAPRAVASLEPGLYRYLPDRHELEKLSDNAVACAPLLEAAARSADCEPPHALLVITSRLARQSEAYGELAYSLVLKEVGGLFQTLYLVAGYLDLGVCALGGGTPDTLFAKLSGTDETTQPIVGELIVGMRR